jgi:hypothetical protein
MRVAIFRTEHVEADRHVRIVFSFSPIEPDEGSDGPGSGPDPWKTVEVPFGSRVAADRQTGESVLYIPGEPKPLTADEVAGRFGP